MTNFELFKMPQSKISIYQLSVSTFPSTGWQ